MIKCEYQYKYLVSKRCEQCKYFGTIMYGVPCCDYCYITGKLRGCECGDNCDKFDSTKKEPHLDRIKRIIWGGVYGN